MANTMSGMEDFESNKDGITQTTERLKETGHNLREQLSSLGHSAREISEERFGDLTRIGSEQLSRLSDYIRERPLAAVAVGLAAGYLLGTLTMKRSS